MFVTYFVDTIPKLCFKKMLILFMDDSRFGQHWLVWLYFTHFTAYSDVASKDRAYLSKASLRL
jgi:hypothetical protein